jgi:phosphatidylinositol glycan class V
MSQIKISSLIRCIFLTALVIFPFAAHQAAAYFIFCSDRPSTYPKWCSNLPPSIYTHVQSTYWNVGFLRYWTLSQLPNFLIASPPLVVISAFALDHFQSLLSEFQGINGRINFCQSLFLTPHAIHATIFSSILLFASHTQIVLRLAASMPFTYWAAAWLFMKFPTCGTLWVAWSVIWSLISGILWATFLPPA